MSGDNSRQRGIEQFFTRSESLSSEMDNESRSSGDESSNAGERLLSLFEASGENGGFPAALLRHSAGQIFRRGNGSGGGIDGGDGGGGDDDDSNMDDEFATLFQRGLLGMLAGRHSRASSSGNDDDNGAPPSGFTVSSGVLASEDGLNGDLTLNDAVRQLSQASNRLNAARMRMEARNNMKAVRGHNMTGSVESSTIDANDANKKQAESNALSRGNGLATNSFEGFSSMTNENVFAFGRDINRPVVAATLHRDHTRDEKKETADNSADDKNEERSRRLSTFLSSSKETGALTVDVGEYGELKSELGLSQLGPPAWEIHSRKALLSRAALANQKGRTMPKGNMDAGASSNTSVKHRNQEFLNSRSYVITSQANLTTFQLGSACTSVLIREPKKAVDNEGADVVNNQRLSFQDNSLCSWTSTALIPLLSAASIEDDDWCSAVRSLVQRVTSSSKFSLESDKQSNIISMTKILLHENNIQYGRVSAERRCLAVRAAIALTFRHGSMAAIISLCNVLLEGSEKESDFSPGEPIPGLFDSSSSASQDPLLELLSHRSLASLPRVMAGQDLTEETSTVGACNEVGYHSWEIKLCEPRARRSVDDRCTAALLGGYIFAYSKALGAVKLGTGFDGTLQSQLYARNDAFPGHTGEVNVPSLREQKDEEGSPVVSESKRLRQSSLSQRRLGSGPSSASGDLFVIGEVLYFHCADSEDLTEGLLATRVDRDNLSVDRSCILRLLAGDDGIPSLHYSRIFASENLLFAVRAHATGPSFPGKGKRKRVTSSNATISMVDWSQVQENCSLEIDVYGHGGWRVNDNSSNSKSVREYNLHLVRSIVLHGNPVIDAEASFLRKSQTSKNAMSKLSFYAMSTGFRSSGKNEQDVIIGVTFPTTTRMSSRTKTFRGKRDENTTNRPLIKKSGGGKTCSCFFDASTGRRLDVRCATPFFPLGRDPSLRPSILFPSDFHPHKKSSEDTDGDPKALEPDQNASSNSSWICEDCEEKNDLGDERCGMCNAERPGSDMWTCTECEEQNPMSEVACGMCDAERLSFQGGKDGNLVGQSGSDIKSGDRLSTQGESPDEIDMATDPVICDSVHGIIWRLPNRVSASNSAVFLVEQRPLLFDPRCALKHQMNSSRAESDGAAGLGPVNVAALIISQLGRLSLMERRANLANSIANAQFTKSSSSLRYHPPPTHLDTNSISGEKSTSTRKSTTPSYLRQGVELLPLIHQLMGNILKAIQHLTGREPRSAKLQSSFSKPSFSNSLYMLASTLLSSIHITHFVIYESTQQRNSKHKGSYIESLDERSLGELSSFLFKDVVPYAMNMIQCDSLNSDFWFHIMKQSISVVTSNPVVFFGTDASSLVTLLDHVLRSQHGEDYETLKSIAEECYLHQNPQWYVALDMILSPETGAMPGKSKSSARSNQKASSVVSGKENLLILSEACAFASLDNIDIGLDDIPWLTVHLSEPPQLSPSTQFSSFFQKIVLAKTPRNQSDSGESFDSAIHKYIEESPLPLNVQTHLKNKSRRSMSPKYKNRHQIDNANLFTRFEFESDLSERTEGSSLALNMRYSPPDSRYKSKAHCKNEGGQGGHGPFLLECEEGFATWILDEVSLTSGKWYYEFEVLGGGEIDGCPQIGWADSAFRGGDGYEHGVGDDIHSWGFDGMRRKAWHAGERNYGTGWMSGDRIGVALDMDGKSMTVFQNNKSQGRFFPNFKHTGGMYPAVTFSGRKNYRFHCRVFFSAGNKNTKGFKYTPPKGYRAVYENIVEKEEKKQYIASFKKLKNMLQTVNSGSLYAYASIALQSGISTLEKIDKVLSNCISMEPSSDNNSAQRASCDVLNVMKSSFTCVVLAPLIIYMYRRECDIWSRTVAETSKGNPGSSLDYKGGAVYHHQVKPQECDSLIETQENLDIFDEDAIVSIRRLSEMLRSFIVLLSKIEKQLGKALRTNLIDSSLGKDLEWLTEFQCACVSFIQVLSLKLLKSQSAFHWMGKGNIEKPDSNTYVSKSKEFGLSKNTSRLPPSVISQWLDSNLFAGGLTTSAKTPVILEDSEQSSGRNNSFVISTMSSVSRSEFISQLLKYTGSDMDPGISATSNPIALRWIAWSRGNRGGPSRMIYKVNARGPNGDTILRAERIILASLLNHVNESIFQEALMQATLVCDEDNQDSSTNVIDVDGKAVNSVYNKPGANKKFPSYFPKLIEAPTSRSHKVLSPLWSLVWKVVNWGSKSAKLLENWDKLVLKEAFKVSKAEKSAAADAIAAAVVAEADAEADKDEIASNAANEKNKKRLSKEVFASLIADAARKKRKNRTVHGKDNLNEGSASFKIPTKPNLVPISAKRSTNNTFGAFDEKIPTAIESKWRSMNLSERSEICSMKFGIDLNTAIMYASDSTGNTLHKLWAARKVPCCDPPKFVNITSKTHVLSPVNSRTMATTHVLKNLVARAHLLCDLKPSLFPFLKKGRQSVNEGHMSVGDGSMTLKTSSVPISPLRRGMSGKMRQASFGRSPQRSGSARWGKVVTASKRSGSGISLRQKSSSSTRGGFRLGGVGTKAARNDRRPGSLNGRNGGSSTVGARRQMASRSGVFTLSRQMMPPTSLLQQAVDFLCSPLDASQILSAILQRKISAENRLIGLETILDVFNSTKDSSIVSILLSNLGDLLRNAWQLPRSFFIRSSLTEPNEISANINDQNEKTESASSASSHTFTDEQTAQHTNALGESDQFVCGPHVLNGVRSCGFSVQQNIQSKFGKLAKILLDWAVSGMTYVSSSGQKNSVSRTKKSIPFSVRIEALDCSSMCFLPSDAGFVLDNNLIPNLANVIINIRKQLTCSFDQSNPSADDSLEEESCIELLQLEDKVWNLFTLLIRSSLTWTQVSNALNDSSQSNENTFTLTSPLEIERLKNTAVTSMLSILDVIVEEATAQGELNLTKTLDALKETEISNGTQILRDVLWQRICSRERIVRHSLTALYSLTSGGMSGGLGYPYLSTSHSLIPFSDDVSTTIARTCMIIIDGSRGPWSMRITRLAIRLLGEVLPRLPLRLSGRQIKESSPPSKSRTDHSSKEENIDANNSCPDYSPEFDPSILPQRLLKVLGNLIIGFDPRGGTDLAGGSCATGGISRVKTSHSRGSLQFREDSLARQFASTVHSVSASCNRGQEESAIVIETKRDDAQEFKDKSETSPVLVKEDSFLWGYKEKEDKMLSHIHKRLNESKAIHQSNLATSRSMLSKSQNSKAGEVTPRSEDLWVVTIREGRYLNIRGDPSLKNRPIGKLERGMIVRVLHEVSAEASNSRIPKEAKFLKIVPPPDIDDSNRGIRYGTHYRGTQKSKTSNSSKMSEAWVLSESEREKLVMPLSEGANTREVYKGFTLLLHANTHLPADKFFREIQERVRIAISKTAQQEGCQWPHRGWQGCEGEFQKVFVEGVLKCGMGPIIRKCTRLECETVAMRLARYGFVTTIVDENSTAARTCDPYGASVGRYRAFGSFYSGTNVTSETSSDKNRSHRNKKISDGATKAGMPASWYGGTTCVSISAELIALLRSLLLLEETGEMVNYEGQHNLLRSGSGSKSTRADVLREAITTHVCNLAKCNELMRNLPQETQSSSTLSPNFSVDDLTMGMGALAVMGGALGCGPLRIGSRVEVTTGPNSTARGIVTRFNIGEPTVSVVLDDYFSADPNDMEIGEELSFATVAVQPIDAVPPLDEASLPITPRMSSALLSIAEATNRLEQVKSDINPHNSWCVLADYIEKVMPWYVAAVEEAKCARLTLQPESGSEEDVEAVLATRAAGLSATEDEVTETKEAQLAARAAGLEEGNDSSVNEEDVALSRGYSVPSNNFRSSFTVWQRHHPQWIAAFLRTQVLSVLWSGLMSDQLPVMNKIHKSSSIELLLSVAENKFQHQLERKNVLMNRNNFIQSHASTSDAILASVAGDLKQLEVQTIHTHAARLDRLFESQESASAIQSSDPVLETNFSSHYALLNSFAKILLFPSGLDPNRTSGVIMATDAMVSSRKFAINERQHSTHDDSSQTLNEKKKFKMSRIRVVEEPHLLNPRKIFPEAQLSTVITDRPIPQHLSTYYFEVHFSGLPVPPLYKKTYGLPSGNNSCHDSFMVGLWVGGGRPDTSRSYNLAADAPGCIWFHPHSGSVFQGGKLIQQFDPDSSKASKWNAMWDPDEGVSYVVGVLWDLDHGSISFIRGAPGDQSPSLVGTIEGVMFPAGMGKQKKLLALRDSQVKSNETAESTVPKIESKSLPGLVYPAFRTSGMTGLRVRLVLEANGIKEVSSERSNLNSGFLWRDDKKRFSGFAPELTISQIRDRIIDWFHVYRSLFDYTPSVSDDPGQDLSTIKKLLSARAVTLKKKVPAPARLCYRARKHAKLTLSAMFPDMPAGLLEAIVIETDFNMQVATEVCLGMDPRLQSIQRSVNSGRTSARRSTMGQSFAEISLRSTLLDHVISQYGNFDTLVSIEEQSIWKGEDGQVRNGVSKDMRIVEIEGSSEAVEKDGTSEGMHIADSCNLDDVWAVVPVQCYKSQYPDVALSRILAILEDKGAAGVIWLVDPPHGDDDKALDQIDFTKSGNTLTQGTSQQGFSSAASAASAIAAISNGMSSEARTAAVVAAVQSAVEESKSSVGDSPSTDAEPFSLPIVLARASTPLYDFSESDMINGWTLRVYVQYSQDQLQQQLKNNQEAKSASTNGDDFDSSSASALEEKVLGLHSSAPNDEPATELGQSNAEDSESASKAVPLPVDKVDESDEKKRESTRSRGLIGEYLLRRSWFCTADEHAEERSATVIRDYEVELENWVYGIKRLLERARLDRPQIEGIVAHLQAGDPDGMGMFQLRDIHPPLPEAALKRPEKRQDLVWKQSGDWPLRMQELWVGHVVNVSGKANEIMSSLAEGFSSQRAGSRKSDAFVVGAYVLLNCRDSTNLNATPVESKPYWCRIISINDDSSLDLFCLGQSEIASGIIRRVPQHLVVHPVIFSSKISIRDGATYGTLNKYSQSRNDYMAYRMLSGGIEHPSFSSFASSRFRGPNESAQTQGPAWISRMTPTLGRAGRIIEVDHSQRENPLILLEFYDPESLRLTRWWYTLKALCSPSFLSFDSNTIDAFLEDEPQEQTTMQMSEGSEKTLETNIESRNCSEGGGGISTEIALGRMYAQRLLLESWTQSQRATPMKESKFTTGQMEEKFFQLAVADCFGPVHAIAERASENLGAAFASGITSGTEGALSCLFEVRDTPNRIALLKVLEDALPTSFQKGAISSAFSRSAKIMIDTCTCVKAGLKHGSQISLNSAVEVICREPANRSSNDSASTTCSIMVHFGPGNIIPGKTALCVYNSKRCSEATRLRRCRSSAAANASTPIWTSSKSVYFRFEGRKMVSNEATTVPSNLHQRSTPFKSSEDGSLASLDVRACMISCEFWYGCWAIEQLVSSLDQSMTEGTIDWSWEIEHVVPSILSLLDFATTESVPPGCRHVAHRLIIKLVRCWIHINQPKDLSNGEFETIQFGTVDQHEKVRSYLSSLANDLKALILYDLQTSSKVRNEMHAIGILSEAEWGLSASMLNMIAESNQSISHLPDTNFCTYSKSMLELLCVIHWSMGDEHENLYTSDNYRDNSISAEEEWHGPACKGCGLNMVVSDYSQGGYEAGYNCDECGASSSNKMTGISLERWFCQDCHSDICFNCSPKENYSAKSAECICCHATSVVVNVMRVTFNAESIPKWFVKQSLEKRISSVVEHQKCRVDIHSADDDLPGEEINDDIQSLDVVKDAQTSEQFNETKASFSENDVSVRNIGPNGATSPMLDASSSDEHSSFQQTEFATPDLGRQLTEHAAGANLDQDRNLSGMSSPSFNDSPGITRSPNAFAVLSESFQEDSADESNASDSALASNGDELEEAVTEPAALGDSTSDNGEMPTTSSPEHSEDAMLDEDDVFLQQALALSMQEPSKSEPSAGANDSERESKASNNNSDRLSSPIGESKLEIGEGKETKTSKSEDDEAASPSLETKSLEEFLKVYGIPEERLFLWSPEDDALLVQWLVEVSDVGISNSSSMSKLRPYDLPIGKNESSVTRLESITENVRASKGDSHTNEIQEEKALHEDIGTGATTGMDASNIVAKISSVTRTDTPKRAKSSSQEESPNTGIRTGIADALLWVAENDNNRATIVDDSVKKQAAEIRDIVEVDMEQKNGENSKTKDIDANARYLDLSRRLGPASVTFSAFEIRLRVAVLQELNTWLLHASQFLDFAQCGWEDETLKIRKGETYSNKAEIDNVALSIISMSLGYKISSLRGLIFPDIKAKLWSKALLFTISNPQSIMEGTSLGTSSNVGLSSDPSAEHRPHLTIDRRLAANVWESYAQRTGTEILPVDVNMSSDMENTNKFMDSEQTPSKSDEFSVDGTLFEQARSQLNNAACWQLRSLPPKDKVLTHMAFEVKLKGEMDDGGPGGPYREFFTSIAQELQASLGGLALLLPSRAYNEALRRKRNNMTQKVHAERCFVLNPSSSSPAYLRQFEFLGILIGCALRTHILFPLELPQLIWKHLVGLMPDRSDLCEIDGESVKDFLSNVEKCSTPEEFDVFVHQTLGHERPAEFDKKMKESGENLATGLPWTCQRSDGMTIDLRAIELPSAQESLANSSFGNETVSEIASGVTFAQRFEFIRRYEQCRLHESKLQLQALARGLQRMVPSHLLRIFTAQEFQRMVCGRPRIDLALLRRHTTLDSKIKEDAPHIKQFWNVLATFSQEDLKEFVQFAYAQRRLPASDEEWRLSRTANMRIMPAKLPQKAGPTSNASSKHRAKRSEKASDKKPLSDAELQVLIDEQLPTAQTCFFDLYLPAYSSEDVMRERLLAVIHLESWNMDETDSAAFRKTSTSNIAGLPTDDTGSTTDSISKKESKSNSTKPSLSQASTSGITSRRKKRKSRKSKSK